MIKVEKRNKIDVISFSVDKINANTTEQLREDVSGVFASSNSKVIINLQGVEYIDSSGFALFLSLHKAARGSFGVLKFANPGERVSELFHALHLHTVFEIYDDLDACVSSFR